MRTSEIVLGKSNRKIRTTILYSDWKMDMRLLNLIASKTVARPEKREKPNSEYFENDSKFIFQLKKLQIKMKKKISNVKCFKSEVSVVEN